jgi:hypothetical protein
MQKLPVVASVLFLILLTVVNIYGNFDARPWSRIEFSNNKKYVFVLISSGNLENYSTRTRKSWEPLNLSPKELQDYESSLANILKEEQEIRRTYQNSGLYSAENLANPLWAVSQQNTENWILKVNEIFIANDGTFVIGYNSHVDELKNDIPDKEEVGVFIYSTNFGLKSYKVSELTNHQDVFSKSMHGYYWTNRDITIDEQHKIFTLIKQNQKDKLEFNINTGEILSNSSEGKPSTCLGFILFLMLVVVLS